MDKRPQQTYGSMDSTTEVHFGGFSRDEEFNSICDNIAANIYKINASWKTLDKSLKSLGTSRDNLDLRNSIHVTQMSTNQVISSTPREFSKLKAMIPKGDKKKELQVDKLMENFTEAMPKYHAMQKLVAEKMKAHLLTVAKIENTEGQEPGNIQQQVQLNRELAFEQDMLLDREARIKQIEEDIIDVNQIMTELSSLVHEQGQNIDSIENGIDHAVTQVQDGASELEKAAQYQRSYRRKLLILVIIVAIAVTVLIAITFSNLKK